MAIARTAAYIIGGVTALFIVRTGPAVAFPFLDPSNQDTVPGGAPLGTDLPATDVKGLRNQLQLTNPAAPGNPSAWTIVPRLTIQELFTDNAYYTESPRRFDAITVVAPGISVIANTARLQLNLDYQPNLIMHAINGPLNVLTQQLNATGLLTVIPDLAYIDVRALSGIQSQNGLVGNGTLGNANAALAPAGSYGGVGVGQQGINHNNAVQTASFGISPYLLHQFKDYGTAKIGASVNYSRYNSIDGFFATPFPTGGANGQSLLSTEQIAQFTTGEFLGRFQDSISVDLQQSTSHAYAGSTAAAISAQGLVTTIPATSFTSESQTINNQLSFALNRYFTLLGSIGYQNTQYSNNVGPHFKGLTWNAGFTVTPGPDSSLTVTYGYQNGGNVFNASGYAAIGGRTQLSLNYSNTVGTQLQNLQNQLNNSVVTSNGQLVNVSTLGPNFTATNALGVQNGVFRFSTLTTSLSTTWLRDTLQLSATWSVQTNLTPGTIQSGVFVDPVTGNLFVISQPISGTNQSSDVKTASVVWTHELSPDLTASSSASYTFIRQSAVAGNQGVLAFAIGAQYTLSQSTTLSGRYSFFDRISHIPGYTAYANTLLLGITKQF